MTTSPMIVRLPRTGLFWLLVLSPMLFAGAHTWAYLKLSEPPIGASFYIYLLQAFQQVLLPFIILFYAFLLWNRDIRSNMLLYHLSLPTPRPKYLAKLWIKCWAIAALELGVCFAAGIFWVRASGVQADPLGGRLFYMWCMLLLFNAFLWSALFYYYTAALFALSSPVIAAFVSIVTFFLCDQLLPLLGLEPYFFSHAMSSPLVWLSDVLGGYSLDFREVVSSLAIWLLWSGVFAAYSFQRFSLKLIAPHALAIAFLLCWPIPAHAEPQVIEKGNWFALMQGGSPLALPEPPLTDATNEHQQSWPLAASHSITQGYSTYPETVREMLLTVIDVDGDGREDIIYQQYQSSSHVHHVWIYRRIPKESVSWEMIAHKTFQLDNHETAPRFELIDLNKDGFLDGVLTTSQRGLYLVPELLHQETVKIFFARGRNLEFSESADVTISTTAVPGWPHFVDWNRDGHFEVAQLKAQAIRPHKDYLLRFLLKKRIDMTMTILDLRKDARGIWGTAQVAQKQGALRLDNDYMPDAGQIATEWLGQRPVAANQTARLRKATTVPPSIHFDFDGDGQMDSVAILPSGEHIFSLTHSQPSQQKVLLEGRSLLSGNFADFDGDGTIDEMRIQYLHAPNGEVESQLTLIQSCLPLGQQRRTPKTSTYRVRGLVQYPVSFFDQDGDGDLDCVAIVYPRRSSLQTFLSKYLSHKLRLKALLYEMTPDGLKTGTPKLVRSVTIKPDSLGSVDWRTVFKH